MPAPDTSERDQRVEDMLRAGHSYRQITQATGASAWIIQRVRRTHKIPLPAHRTWNPPITGDARATLRRDLAQAYRDGASIAAVGALAGRSSWFARQILIEAGITFRPPGPPSTTRYR